MDRTTQRFLGRGSWSQILFMGVHDLQWINLIAVDTKPVNHTPEGYWEHVLLAAFLNDHLSNILRLYPYHEHAYWPQPS